MDAVGANTVDIRNSQQTQTSNTAQYNVNSNDNSYSTFIQFIESTTTSDRQNSDSYCQYGGNNEITTQNKSEETCVVESDSIVKCGTSSSRYATSPERSWDSIDKSGRRCGQDGNSSVSTTYVNVVDNVVDGVNGINGLDNVDGINGLDSTSDKQSTSILMQCFPKGYITRNYIRNDAYNFWLIILLTLLFILLVIISFLQHGRWTWFGVFLFFAIPVVMILLSFAVITDTYCGGRGNLWSSGTFWFYIISSLLLVASVMSSGGNAPRTTAMLFTILCLMSLIVLMVLLIRTSMSLIILSIPSVVVILLFYIYLV